MTAIDSLIQRNEEFATHGFAADLSLMPTLRTIIIGCVDPRVDPAHVRHC
jgi:carbonic anhydrase